mgnify:CR=1 FL=1
MGRAAARPHGGSMENKGKQPVSIKTKTSIALLAGVITACAGVAIPGPAHANPSATCTDPLSALQVKDVRKLTTRGERHLHNQPLGAAILVAPTAGMTLADLQRAAECHAGAANDGSPLGVEGVEVSVTRAGKDYELHLTSDSRSGALEILRRAQAAAQR